MTPNELTPATPAQSALIDERARQEKSGEFAAGYWNWYSDSRNRTWQFVAYEPAQAHPHYETFKKWEALVVSCEVGKGWWEVMLNYENSGFINRSPDWRLVFAGVPCTYEIRKTNLHPDNIKPKLRLIDWSKMPAGTMMNKGELLEVIDGDKCLLDNGYWLRTINKSHIVQFWPSSHFRLAEQPKFTFWRGGDCPVPNSVKFEIIFRDGITRLADGASHIFRWKHVSDSQSKMIDIIAYRIIGLAEGYTDNPEEAL